MNEPTPQPGKPATPSRYPLIMLCALICFGATVAMVTLLPIAWEVGLGLTYPAVFLVAGVSITLIFRLFVKRA